MTSNHITEFNRQFKSKFILHNARTKSSAYCAMYMHALFEILQVLHILV